jgi:hypothetical protein
VAAYHLLNTIQLPRGLVWSDELNWVAREAATEYSLTGALLIDVGVRLAGRPITLEAADDAGWMPRATVRALMDLCDADPDAAHVLTLADGRTFDVRFAAGDTPITAHAVLRPELPPDTYPYVATVRLITV